LTGETATDYRVSFAPGPGRRKDERIYGQTAWQSEWALDFYGWLELVEFVRSLLVARTLVPTALVPHKELTYRYRGKRDAITDMALGHALGQNNRIGQYVFRVASYVVKAAELPTELSQRLEDDINDLSERVRREELDYCLAYRLSST
jgi:hypothetical protein